MVRNENQISTKLTQDALVGMKRKCARGWRWSQRLTSGVESVGGFQWQTRRPYWNVVSVGGGVLYNKRLHRNRKKVRARIIELQADAAT